MEEIAILIEEFFQSTTIHGLAYLHSRHPKISRLIWVSAGFLETINSIRTLN